MYPADAHLRRPRAFTLTEVLVVVAIIAMIAAILLPSLSRARERSREALCLSNLHTIGSQMSMYQATYRGWLPVGPADRLAYVDKYVYPPQIYDTPQPNTEPLPAGNCEWGGRRAEYNHYVFASHRQPEVLPRPLTAFMYPRSTSLDTRQPIFECPSDIATPFWNPIGKGIPYYRVCGNSYYLNIWGSDGNALADPFPSVSRKRMRGPSAIVVTEEAPFFMAMYHQTQDMGWHGSFSRHNLLFLDFHAASRQTDTRNYYGPGWMVVQYWDIMDYYR